MKQRKSKSKKTISKMNKKEISFNFKIEIEGSDEKIPIKIVVPKDVYFEIVKHFTSKGLSNIIDENLEPL